MWKLVVFLGCLFLGACQNTYEGGYVPRFSEYVGLKERVLFEDFGNPDFYYEVDGVRYLVYGLELKAELLFRVIIIQENVF